jgi:hypothetical protein
MLLLNFILIAVIRGMRKRHTWEILNLVDDNTTCRDRISKLGDIIRGYERLRATDEKMIDRTLKELERIKEDIIESMRLLSAYKSLSIFAYERCQRLVSDMSPAEYHLVREALRQLYNLNTKPDAGKPTGNGQTEGTPTIQ